MPRQKPKPTEYELLRAIWYQKLKDEGFDDVEQDEDNLKVWSSKFTQRRSLELMQSRAAYYYMAENFLRDYQFKTNLEKIIWEYHTNAVSKRDITELLRKSNIAKTNHTTVGMTIRRLAEIMKKMYMSSND